jgi:plasmid segregation protein ParM
MNVVVDMGYFTLDYLVAQGQRPFPDRSGAVEGGMAGFYDELHRAADREYMDKYPQLDSRLAFNHSFYEQALLRGQTVIKPGGSPLSLERPLQAASTKLIEYLDRVGDGLGRTSDIENVILAGGGASFLEPHLKERFKNLTSVITPPRPQLAIAEGFLTVGIGAARGASR